MQISNGSRRVQRPSTNGNLFAGGRLARPSGRSALAAGALLALAMGARPALVFAGDASTADCFTTLGSSANRGTSQVLVVRDGWSRTYLRLGLSSLPPGTVGADVSKATLRAAFAPTPGATGPSGA